MVETDGWPKPSDFEDPNDYFLEMLFESVKRLMVERGLSESAAGAHAAETMIAGIQEASVEHAEKLEELGQAFVEESAELRAGFSSRLRVHWGEPLDLFEKFVSAVEEGGSLFARRNIGQSPSRELLLSVLVQLNGQAVRAAREVHVLLSAGFPLGAHALSRTLHEIAVRAGVLAHFGVDAEQAELAERFVLHARVINYRDAVVYQRDALRLGYEPISPSSMAEMEAQHDELLQRFGPAFGGPYGWAVDLPRLPKPKRPTFEDLEDLAGLGHVRGIYRWSSHFVHADAKSLNLNRVERGGSSAVLVNATNTMLADPGQNTLIGLYRVFISMVTSAETFAFYDQLLCASLQIMLDNACAQFVEGEESVMAAEDRFQADLAVGGLRFDLVAGAVPIDGRAGAHERDDD